MYITSKKTNTTNKMKTQNIILISLIVISITSGLYVNANTNTNTSRLVEGYYNAEYSNSKKRITNKQLAWIIFFIIVMILFLILLALADKPV